MTTDTVSVDRDDLRQLAADLEEAADLGMLAMQERIAELAQRVRAMAGKAEPEGGETWGGLLYTLNTMRKERDEARAEVERLRNILANLRIVFDGPPGHEGGQFVEAEISGISVRGDWHEHSGDGAWSLGFGGLLGGEGGGGAAWCPVEGCNTEETD